MQYLTAHTVLSSRFEGQGTNAYAHRRPGVVSSNGDLRSIIDQVQEDPGQIAGCAIEIPPGNNEILAFIDLLVQDDVEISTSLQQARRAIAATAERDVVGALDDAGIFRFHVGTTLERLTTFDQLEAAVQKAARSPLPVPLRIELERGEDTEVFRLDDSTLSRLRRVHGPSWTSGRVQTQLDLAEDFQRSHGPLVPHVVQVLTGLTRVDAERLGGVVIERRDGTRLDVWPAAAWYPRPQ